MYVSGFLFFFFLTSVFSIIGQVKHQVKWMPISDQEKKSPFVSGSCHLFLSALVDVPLSPPNIWKHSSNAREGPVSQGWSGE